MVCAASCHQITTDYREPLWKIFTYFGAVNICKANLLQRSLLSTSRWMPLLFVFWSSQWKIHLFAAPTLFVVMASRRSFECISGMSVFLLCTPVPLMTVLRPALYDCRPRKTLRCGEIPKSSLLANPWKWGTSLGQYNYFLQQKFQKKMDVCRPRSYTSFYSNYWMNQVLVK